MNLKIPRHHIAATIATVANVSFLSASASAASCFNSNVIMKNYHRETKELRPAQKGAAFVYCPRMQIKTHHRNFSSVWLGASSKFSYDMYDPSELQGVLDLHLIMQGDVSEEEIPPSESSLSLHDLVVQMAASDDATKVDSQPIEKVLQPPSSSPSIMIRAIASDVDGTIISRDQSIHERTRSAIAESLSATNLDGRPIIFFPATGKSRKGCLGSLGDIGTALHDLGTPGVFLQGLVVCCGGTNGENVIYEQKLSKEAIEALENVIENTVGSKSVSLVGYDGDDLVTTSDTDIVKHLCEHYGEPMPRLLDTMLADHSNGLHKVLIMDDDTDMLTNKLRPSLEVAASQYGATVTQAIPTMLEWLPAGCSKANGVSKLCDHLGIDISRELLAIGDAENDAEMLSVAAIGVAVANGCNIAKQAANFVIEETNDMGGAGAAIEKFGGLR